MNKLVLLTTLFVSSAFADDLKYNLKPWDYKEEDHKLMAPNEATIWLTNHPSKPDPEYKIGDAIVEMIDGRRMNMIVVHVFWDGRKWTYIKVLDHRIEI